jgi:hypothetical protein
VLIAEATASISMPAKTIAATAAGHYRERL